MTTELLAVVFGLAAALGWGAGDFSGGLASRRGDVYLVILVSQLFSIVLLILLALLWGEPIPAGGDLLVGGLAGIIGAIGLVTLYRALATMAMGLVAPVTAVVAAGLPVIVAAFTEGLPAPQQFLGFAAALAGVWFISRGSERATGRAIRPRDLLLPLFAGATFGLFFILIDQVSDRAVYWPLVAARTASITLITATILANPRRTRAPAGSPPLSRQMPLLALVGVLETSGNVFFALATSAGRLDIASVLASLYPAGTVLLAWLVLKERLAPRQWAGVAASLLAIVLIAL
ncbi:MAG: DMT family transporter [Chloroflexi bacterium]|jgi:drug/metabolite transporter (DMT)-like permease|nr:DMT family transporter [Chloroflexota bacterium]